MQTPDSPALLPPSPLLDRWVQPFARFFRIEAASGVALVICAGIALLLANTPLRGAYLAIWQLPISFSLGEYRLEQTFGHLISEGLMTIFFFVVGLEIKREIVAGELRDPRKAALPVMAAIGGMALPALIYLALQGGQPGEAGWGTPIATDIAFVVALISLFGTRVPPGLKILILSLAIADDIGAVLVIALFFSSEIALLPLGFGIAGFGITYFFNRIGVRRVPIYVLIGIGIWLAFLHSGVHPTVAGVMLGLLTPASAWVGEKAFFEVASEAIARLRGAEISSRRQRQRSLGHLATTAHESISPLERLQFSLHPWVAFVIVPLFALANAGVSIDTDAVTHPVAAAVAAGLVIGKPVGIVSFAWLAVRLGIARLPLGVDWGIMLGAGCLAGIGFTMSLLIAGHSLDGEILEAGKIGTLAGSCVSAIAGTLLLLVFLRPGLREGQKVAASDGSWRTAGAPEHQQRASASASAIRSTSD